MRIRQLAVACAAIALIAGVGSPMAAAGEDVPIAETVRLVRRALDRLPYYGVFDFLAFSVENRTVRLRGFAHRQALRREAEDVARKATGLEIDNQIEILPASRLDEDIRWAAFQRIYSGELGDRYVRGGSAAVAYELANMTLFPGMEPYGIYPVHVIVKDRRLHLVGVVDSTLDKTRILIQAGQVPHTLGLDDAVAVRTP